MCFEFPQTVVNHLHDGLGMKCFHLRWVPHLLSETQKANRVAYAKEMSWVLDNNARTGFKYLLTGDESHMHYDQSPATILALDREYVDQKFRATNYQPKTLITVFFGVDGIALLGILPQGWKLTSEYFPKHIIRAFAVENTWNPEKSACHATSFILIMHPSITLKKSETL
jgi:hypothetical protein